MELKQPCCKGRKTDRIERTTPPIQLVLPLKLESYNIQITGYYKKTEQPQTLVDSLVKVSLQGASR